MKQFNIKITQYTVRDFISWQKSGSLEINPNFQRRPVWNKTAKSFLVDSILRGLPVPIVFLREKIGSLDDLEPKREVVDGQQRLRTLFGYIRKDLLKDFNEDKDEFVISGKHNKDLKNCSFKDLSEEDQRRILDYQFSVHILPADVDDREVLKIFSRMNSTGVKLKRQELRNAEFIGELKNSIYECSFDQLYRWRDWGIFTELSISRMDEAEFVSEFFEFMINGVKSKNQTDLDKLYDTNEDDFKGRGVAEKRFNEVMDYIDEECGDLISKTIFKKPPFLLCLMMYLYEAMYGKSAPLKNLKKNKLKFNLKNSLSKLSTDVDSESLPADLLEVIKKRRLTTEEFRNTFIKYLKKRIK